MARGRIRRRRARLFDIDAQTTIAHLRRVQRVKWTVTAAAVAILAAYSLGEREPVVQFDQSPSPSPQVTQPAPDPPSSPAPPIVQL